MHLICVWCVCMCVEVVMFVCVCAVCGVLIGLHNTGFGAMYVSVGV